MKVPAHLLGYSCGDYFASEWAASGCWDEAAQIRFVIPATEVEEQPKLSLLVVGRPGVDGILFGYRLGQVGLWAYHPIEREFTFIAPSIVALVEGWASGKIVV